MHTNKRKINDKLFWIVTEIERRLFFFGRSKYIVHAGYTYAIETQKRMKQMMMIIMLWYICVCVWGLKIHVDNENMLCLLRLQKVWWECIQMLIPSNGSLLSIRHITWLEFISADLNICLGQLNSQTIGVLYTQKKQCFLAAKKIEEICVLAN